MVGFKVLQNLAKLRHEIHDFMAAYGISPTAVAVIRRPGIRWRRV
jgi:hypothetical protein